MTEKMKVFLLSFLVVFIGRAALTTDCWRGNCSFVKPPIWWKKNFNFPRWWQQISYLYSIRTKSLWMCFFLTLTFSHFSINFPYVCATCLSQYWTKWLNTSKWKLNVKWKILKSFPFSSYLNKFFTKKNIDVGLIWVFD